jgi:hypothetical protein
MGILHFDSLQPKSHTHCGGEVDALCSVKPPKEQIRVKKPEREGEKAEHLMHTLKAAN